MPSYDEITHVSAAPEKDDPARESIGNKTLLDYFSLAFATFGVGYIPFAPGTFGSAVGILIYLFIRVIETNFEIDFLNRGWNTAQINSWIYAVNSIAVLLFCLLGIWTSNRAVGIFQTKDPQKIVVDEVMGQLIVFLFVPFFISWKIVLAGFVLFRLFDIWKPYPINSLEKLPSGIGVCADDILAGVYGGICLCLLYAVSFSFKIL